MSAFQEGFQRTVKSFKNRLTGDQLQEVECNSLSDLYVTINRIQYQQRDQKQMMNLNRVKSFLEAMGQFEQVIKVFLNVNSLVAFIWGPIKLLLQVSVASNLPLYEYRPPEHHEVLRALWTQGHIGPRTSVHWWLTGLASTLVLTMPSSSLLL